MKSQKWGGKCVALCQKTGGLPPTSSAGTAWIFFPHLWKPAIQVSVIYSRAIQYIDTSMWLCDNLNLN